MLELVGVTKKYDSNIVLNNVSMLIERGSFTTILGPSGSGKSTLLMTLAGFTEPSSGDILLNGSSILARPPERRNFGVVFQGYALFPHLIVRDNVSFPLQLRKVPKHLIDKKVDETLALVRLQSLAGRFPQELSGGQQQRVAIARSLVFDPELVLLDEPLSALDKNLREELREELRNLHRRVGMTFVLVTHDQEEALDLSDRIAVINNGILEQLDSPQNIYDRPNNRFVAQFIGQSNFLNVDDVSHDEQGSLSLRVKGKTFKHAPKGPAGGSFHTLMLRPESICISPQAPAASGNQMSGSITDISYRGPMIGLTIATEIGSLFAIVASSIGPVKLNDVVFVSWSADTGVLLSR